jgi:hypothetical protein
VFLTLHTRRSGQDILTSSKHLSIGTPQKKEFYLLQYSIQRYHQQLLIWMHGLTDCCRAAASVLKAQEEAFSSLNGIRHAKLGTMTALVAAANTTVQEVANDLQMSLKFPTASPSSPKAAGSMDNVGILKVWLTPLLNSFQMYF